MRNYGPRKLRDLNPRAVSSLESQRKWLRRIVLESQRIHASSSQIANHVFAVGILMTIESAKEFSAQRRLPGLPITRTQFVGLERVENSQDFIHVTTYTQIMNR